MAESSPDKTHIFEATNDTLRESYVGATALSLEALEQEHRRQAPELIAHWRSDHQISYELVETDLSKADSRAFIENYVRSIAAGGWKVFTDS